MTDGSLSSTESQSYLIDADNAAEMARLMLQDQVLTQAMGGPLAEQTDLTGINQILDLACGPGGWLFETLTRYPQMHGIGVDTSHLMIEYANTLATSQGIAPLHFRIMDITQPLRFSEAAFDLVNARLLTGVLLKHQWIPLLAECARITRPGGILRLTEVEWGLTTSAALETLARLTGQAGVRAGHCFSPGGRTTGTTPVLRSLLRRAGYQDIGQQAHVFEYSAGTAGYESGMHNSLIFYKLIQPFLVQMGVTTHEEIDQLYAQMETDLLSPDFCALDYILTVWGRKGEEEGGI